jgi:hypothetical protein
LPWVKFPKAAARVNSQMKKRKYLQAFIFGGKIKILSFWQLTNGLSPLSLSLTGTTVQWAL